MRRVILLLLAVGLGVWVPGGMAGRGGAETPVYYVDFSRAPVRELVGDPPAAGTPENAADIRAVLARQARRTRGQVARARSEEALTPGAFARVFGPWFNARRLPRTFGLLERAASDAERMGKVAKGLWNRPRPPLQDGAIRPVVALPANGSYPSFHAVRGELWGVLLARLEPDMRRALLARGAQIGEDRIMGGVHFPTDVAAGQRIGRYIAGELMKNPEFQCDMAGAGAELGAARARHGLKMVQPGHHAAPLP